MAEAGLLMSYGTDMFHQVGIYTGNILKVRKPAIRPA
jgi:hypothetical protein